VGRMDPGRLLDWDKGQQFAMGNCQRAQRRSVQGKSFIGAVLIASGRVARSDRVRRLHRLQGTNADSQ
jgi:hypothetical protein